MAPEIHNIILTGFMGTGKTSVGGRLGQALGWRFIDTDDLIVQKAGKSISDVFAEDGEDVFRQMESEVAREVARFKHHAIATGGGMILREENLRALEEAGMVVLLEASPEVIYERTCEDTNRPLLAGPDPRGAIDRLLAQRREAYHRVPIRIDTDGLELKEVADAILKHYHARESMTD